MLTRRSLLASLAALPALLKLSKGAEKKPSVAMSDVKFDGIDHRAPRKPEVPAWRVSRFDPASNGPICAIALESATKGQTVRILLSETYPYVPPTFPSPSFGYYGAHHVTASATASEDFPIGCPLVVEVVATKPGSQPPKE